MYNDNYINNKKSLCSALRFESLDDKSKGNEFVLANNGQIELLIDVSHGFDIAWLRYQGQMMSCLINNGFTHKNENFDYSFDAGFLYTCGLDSIGNRDGYPLHGRLHHTPARITTIKEGEELVLQAEVEFTKFFGFNFTLIRTIKTSFNSSTITIDDTIKNNLEQDTDYCLLYHFNFGYPFIDENSIIDIKSKNITPRTEYSKLGIDTWHTYSDGIKEIERVYFHEQSNGHVVIHNTQSKINVAMDYDMKNLPALIEWKCQVAKNYALGIEPATSFLDHYFQYQKLKGKEEIHNHFVFTFSKDN